MHFWVRCFVWQDPPASFAYTRQAAAYPRYGSSLAPLAGEGRGERQRLLRRREGLERWHGGPPRGSPERLSSGRALTIIVLRHVRRVGDRLEGERVLSNELEEPAAQPLALLERLAQLLVFRDHVVPAQTHATDHGHQSGGDAASESGSATPGGHRPAGGQVCGERADGRVRWLSHTLSSHLGATRLRCDNPREPWHRTPGSGGTRGKSPVLPSAGSFMIRCLRWSSITSCARHPAPCPRPCRSPS